MGMKELTVSLLTGRPLRASTTIPLDFQHWVNYFKFGNNLYQFTQTITGNAESIETSFTGMVRGAYKGNGIVFSVMLARLMLFTEARLQFRRRQSGRGGELYGQPSLRIFEKPWLNANTGTLLAKMIQHADVAGNAYVARMSATRLRVMRPDWVTIVMGVPEDEELGADDLNAELLGYMYHPGGPHSGAEPVILTPERVAHWAPIPDPEASYRGMSWLTPIIRDVEGDQAATTHKLNYFDKGATPNLVVSLDPAIEEEAFKRWVAKFRKDHEGAANAYRTLFLGGGAKVERVGNSLLEMNYKLVQGAGETRIAAAGGVPPVIAGFSEGLEAATYSNYGQARRRFADLTMRPLWRSAAGALSALIPVPENSELWYDDRDIPFLSEDIKDRAEVQMSQASTMKQLIDAGFKPESVVAAVNAEDWGRLAHTGLFSVQLQPPGAAKPAPPGPSPEE